MSRGESSNWSRNVGLTFHGKLWVEVGLVVMSLELGWKLSEQMSPLQSRGLAGEMGWEQHARPYLAEPSSCWQAAPLLASL